ncbi:MAG: LytTR family DNA-binding domain-containing protein [Fusobacterium mortiferum]|jgi:two-component system LytT family response regulator|uniref:DNA-binding response regulator n=1 Tax=Fusobacterium mortiferum TaxID=850 RepID=A0A414PU07_FUSMR|nr:MULTISPECIES: LytTR family DNA-binding domain-containing protein [Fusobacterium]MCF2700252.1 response regulator transcription factor [Fusobacterium mortiferum]MCI6382429.1 LytTR family DNA-binding domain-containing protein [Fusobacterium mortiferum]MCI7188435.1 LytTR family DNA-binding domain-containing protein [Fusobacterium mortiferum]MCI7666075.1 LytTR family DNA-binding domain-containing protein [Fusobacterium mortiferum]MDY2800216.1 LytTR family DNA-binding domain-containing protein [F
MLTCVIVEDEFPAREELKYFLTKHKEISLEKEFENPIDSLKYLQENKVDVVFLDINMPELDGMSLGKILTKLNPNIKIIFITAYRDYAAEAFEIKAFDYLLKPYSEKRITEVLNNLTMIKDNSPTKEVEKINKVTVFLDEKMVVLSLDEIYYIEVSEKESLVYTQNEIYTSKLKISKWEEILPKNKFYRTHRAYIVNLDKIKEVEPWFNGTFVLKIQDLKFKVPVSRNNIKEFKELLSIK